MSTPLSPDARGALFMVVSMAAFAIEDLCVKLAAQSLPVGVGMICIGLGGVMIFSLLALRRGESLMPRAFLSRAMLIRCAFEICGRVFYALALAFTALSASSAILQAAPLVVVAGAALVFGEPVGWRRWLAVAVGFVGVLIILRPGVDGFSALSLLAVLGMFGFAGRDLATRAAPKGLSNRQLGVLGFAMLTLAGFITLAWSGGARLPDARELPVILIACIFSVLGYHLLSFAMRTGNVAAVTPFRYVRLIFALALAIIFLDERPDLPMLLGSALVVASGLYGLARPRNASRPI